MRITWRNIELLIQWEVVQPETKALDHQLNQFCSIYHSERLDKQWIAYRVLSEWVSHAVRRLCARIRGTVGPVAVTLRHARVRGTAGRAVSLFACAAFRPLSFISRKNSAPFRNTSSSFSIHFMLLGFFCNCWCFVWFYSVGNCKSASSQISATCPPYQLLLSQ